MGATPGPLPKDIDIQVIYLYRHIDNMSIQIVYLWDARPGPLPKDTNDNANTQTHQLQHQHQNSAHTAAHLYNCNRYTLTQKNAHTAAHLYNCNRYTL